MSRARGFTLLEVMVSVALLSLVMVATLAALRTLGNTRSTVGQIIGRVDEIRSVSGFLRNSIGAALPVMRMHDPTQSTAEDVSYGTNFVGDAAHLEWVSPLLAGANMGGVFVQRLALVGDVLEFQWAPYRRDLEATNWDEVASRSLLRGVDTLEIGYLPAYGQDWQDTWTTSLRNPAAVRINLRSAQRYWPEIVIRLNAAQLNVR